MKTLKGFLLTLTVVSFLLGWVNASSARPDSATNLALTARSLPPRPPSLPLAIASKPSAIGEVPEDPIILDQYDYVEAAIPAANVPSMQLWFVSYYESDPKKNTMINIKPDEVVYFWEDKLVFDKWGTPGTELAAFNSFVLEPSDLFLIGAWGAGEGDYMNPTFQSASEIEYPYTPDLDPTTLNQPNGTVVDVNFYLALKSECQFNNSEKSPLCPAYRLRAGGSVGIVPTNGVELTALKFSQDPEQGALPDESYPFSIGNGNGGITYFKKLRDSGVLQMRCVVK